MNNKKITIESAMNRIKKALEHKKQLKKSIEEEFFAAGKKANVVFL